MVEIVSIDGHGRDHAVWSGLSWTNRENPGTSAAFGIEI
jgi:hypothetical protein